MAEECVNSIEIENISGIGRNYCTGCLACINVCPAQCISVDYDSEGFFWPSINHKECIRCKKCTKVCQVMFLPQKNSIINGYAAAIKNKDISKESSSGGIFPALALSFISDGGYVCGAGFCPDLTVRHTVTDKPDNVLNMRGSKYVQSFLSPDTYTEIEKLLSDGKKVLFVGTPCQVAGMKNRFSQAEGLFCIDLICHGVPSPVILKKHLERNYQKAAGRIYSVKFREKTKCENNEFRFVINTERKKIRVYASDDPYYNAFLQGKSFRECCYNCKFASCDRTGDITIGDCANHKAYSEYFAYGEVLSTVLINTSKGIALWNRIKDRLNYVKADIRREAELNEQLSRPFIRPAQRDEFYKDFYSMDKSYFESKYVSYLPAKARLKRTLRRIIPLSIKGIIRWAVKN
ncbi:coenzyme F420-reducing hydrogenase beta subunit [Herbinix hemicellulosilytica]|uniref:4Fe-4S ferredoxin-type domain-containing protein n=1 Tax=Herbinix hemicellulosilytica TaxID=1564487 RepID=A0A0H5SIL8_HERHM|nr:Coenzyme F420 hydrogenase/dehydrogenase, beta subunit C-terminal domain [Herbinix hemicellulosilytica]RBP60941.1 coenzyme F420-reducing hydrogenase beta subunit [Herbinix hemicellulosilytica]CRZ34636.1 hypothetical protein HHT355_1435 [Herbinix hemicellulosilytica]